MRQPSARELQALPKRPHNSSSRLDDPVAAAESGVATGHDAQQALGPERTFLDKLRDLSFAKDRAAGYDDFQEFLFQLTSEPGPATYVRKLLVHYSLFKDKKTRVSQRFEGAENCSFDGLASHWFVRRSGESQGAGDDPEGRVQQRGIDSALES